MMGSFIATTFLAVFVLTKLQVEALECFDNQDQELTKVSECEAGIDYCSIQIHPDVYNKVVRNALTTVYSCASELLYCNENGEGCHRAEDGRLVCCCKGLINDFTLIMTTCSSYIRRLLQLSQVCSNIR